MNYVISDFKNLVGAWFNEFLPSVAGKKAAYVEKAGIVYISNLNIESLRNPTTRFILNRIGKMLESNGAIHIFAQEPKPVNNVRIRPSLQIVEKMSLDDENRDRILHLANRRYVLGSDSVYVSQNKEIDDFMADIFVELSKIELEKTRFYHIRHLGIEDFISCASDFFPRSSLSIQKSYRCGAIEVHSANDVLGVLSRKIMDGKSPSSSTLDFVERCKDSILDDIANLV